MTRTIGWLMVIGALLVACVPSTPAAPPPTRSADAATTATRPPAGAVLFRDDFSDPGSGWDVAANEKGQIGYDGGSYRIRVDATEFSVWGNPGRSFGDVAVEVAARRESGPENGELGVICRYVDRQNFVYASLSPDGYYGIAQMRAGDLKMLTGGGRMARAVGLPPTDVMHLRFICRGDRYTLIVNDVVIDAVTLAGFDAGDVGLLAGTFDRPGLVARFDDLVVSEPPAAEALSGQVLFSDDFSNPTGGWDVTSTNNGSTGYGPGGYVIKVTTPNYQLWANPGRSFRDVSVEVTAALASGPQPNELGVICRYRDADNFMYAAISTSGTYGLYEVKNAKSTLLNRSGRVASSEAIQRGAGANRLTFICRGEVYELRINGVTAETIEHAGFDEGDVGLIAGTFDRGGVEARFSDFVVTQP